MRRVTERLRRLPIRVRLTLISAGAMAVLFGCLALFLYVHFRSSLDASINAALRARTGEIAGIARGLSQPVATASRRPLRDRGEAFAQVLDRRGDVLDASVGLEQRSLLSQDEVRGAFAHTLLVDRGERSRLYADAAGPDTLVVVGVSLAQREKALETLNGALLAGAPLALLVASLISYALMGTALRTVERMRRRAATISTEDLDARLPLPDSVDEIYRLGSTLNEMLARLHAGLERERQFVTDASHELRTPLAVLKAELEVALCADGSRHQWRSAVASAVEEADRVINLAEDLLVLARAQHGELPLAPIPVDADALLDAAAQRIAAAAARAGRRVVVEPAPGVKVAADPARIGQALDNLTDNALRHGHGTVTLSAVSRGDRVELHVADEGPGFATEFLPHAFERFSRADATRGRGGAGLGLALAETIATAHGGHAGAVNRGQGGADVWLTLPAAGPRIDGSEPAGGSSQDHLIASRDPAGRERALAADPTHRS